MVARSFVAELQNPDWSPLGKSLWTCRIARWAMEQNQQRASVLLGGHFNEVDALWHEGLELWSPQLSRGRSEWSLPIIAEFVFHLANEFARWLGVLQLKYTEHKHIRSLACTHTHPSHETCTISPNNESHVSSWFPFSCNTLLVFHILEVDLKKREQMTHFLHVGQRVSHPQRSLNPWKTHFVTFF